MQSKASLIIPPFGLSKSGIISEGSILVKLFTLTLSYLNSQSKIIKIVKYFIFLGHLFSYE